MAGKLLEYTQVMGQISANPAVCGGNLVTETPDASNPVEVPQGTVRDVCSQEDIVTEYEFHRTLNALKGSGTEI